MLLMELLAILCGVGLIVGAICDRLSGTLINELLFMAGGSVGVLPDHGSRDQLYSRDRYDGHSGLHFSGYRTGSGTD